jgi:peptidoglycan-associated lipoprotein
MNRHPITLLAGMAALAVMAGCATPSATTPSRAAAPAPAPVPMTATPSRPATPPAGAAAGLASGGSRGAALAPAPVPAATAAASSATVAPAMPENASVYFDFDDARMKQADLTTVERYGRYLAAVPAATARVEGHADERGSREYNLALGQRRAQSVVDAMKVLGVAEGRVEAVSYGEERPRAKGSNEQAWAQNRRADLAVRR